MTERFSLSDQAVSALAAVQRMDVAITNEHAERQHIRTLKRLAEQSLEAAFRHAQELAYLAEQIHTDAQEARDVPPSNEQTGESK